jgi:hypothetical protein
MDITGKITGIKYEITLKKDLKLDFCKVVFHTVNQRV